MVEPFDTPDLPNLEDRRWTPVLQGLRADALDCLQTTFALIADGAHGVGTHLALGARWGVSSPASTLDTRAAEARELLGLRPVARWQDIDGPNLRQEAALHECLYVTADAYYMPWLPLVGRQHMAHSFLLGSDSGGLVVVDAYHNETPWGPARPGAWRVRARQLDDAVAAGATAIVLTADPLPPLDVATVLASNAEQMRTELLDRRMARARAMIGDRDTDGCEAMERLVLDIWLTCRERLLHAAWLENLPQPPAAAPDMAQQAEDWRQLAAQSYISLRRARRGRSIDAGVVEGLARLLGRDIELATRLGQRDGGERARLEMPLVRGVVVTALGTVLGLDAQLVDTACTLRDLPGFDSFRLVEAIEEVEEILGVEAAVDRVGAVGLRDVDGLCRLFAAAGASG